MYLTSVPIIVVCCYIIGEIFRCIIKDGEKKNKLISLIMSISGGLLGIIIFFTNPEIIFNAENIWVALLVGIASGSGSIGADKILKQIFNKGVNGNGKF